MQMRFKAVHSAGLSRTARDVEAGKAVIAATRSVVAKSTSLMPRFRSSRAFAQH
jgi:hypothetical protein